jgi:hypothetical protein
LAKHKADATPTKDFFVRMITKDISLEDCILDLIDNCLDGARKVKHAANAGVVVVDYSGFHAKVDFSATQFSIADNCGGIKIAEAIDYAFHFGRRANAPSEGDYSIGLYGIGMKRAIFKIGNVIDICSSTATEAFRTHIDVNDWLTKTRASTSGGPQIEDWDFDMDDAPLIEGTGTTISVSELHPSIAAQFSISEFGNGLARIVGRDYAQFISKGFEIFINGRKIPGFPFTIRQSDEFKPIRTSFTDETGVEVEIIAGMAGTPPDDLQPTERHADTDYFGWFVLCNDRVVVASDKTDQTVWGDGEFPGWHYQYNGFIGVVSFHAKDPNLLPWRTTKRDVDGSSGVYRRAVERMKDATRPWIKYTGDRRVDIEEAKKREASATTQSLFDVQANPTFNVPRVMATSDRIAVSSIQYRKPTSEISKVKKMLGNARMTNYEVGIRTFDYYVKNESEE